MDRAVCEACSTGPGVSVSTRRRGSEAAGSPRRTLAITWSGGASAPKPSCTPAIGRIREHSDLRIGSRSAARRSGTGSGAVHVLAPSRPTARRSSRLSRRSAPGRGRCVEPRHRRPYRWRMEPVLKTLLAEDRGIRLAKELDPRPIGPRRIAEAARAQGSTWRRDVPSARADRHSRATLLRGSRCRRATLSGRAMDGTGLAASRGEWPRPGARSTSTRLVVAQRVCRRRGGHRRPPRLQRRRRTPKAPVRGVAFPC
jgi:hypothetical protein